MREWEGWGGLSSADRHSLSWRDHPGQRRSMAISLCSTAQFVISQRLASVQLMATSFRSPSQGRSGMRPTAATLGAVGLANPMHQNGIRLVPKEFSSAPAKASSTATRFATLSIGARSAAAPGTDAHQRRQPSLEDEGAGPGGLSHEHLRPAIIKLRLAEPWNTSPIAAPAVLLTAIQGDGEGGEGADLLLQRSFLKCLT